MATTDRSLSSARPLVLVVDDNAVNQRLAALMLERLGFKAEVADNGLEAVDAAARTAYAAILMDCRMPGMDGYEATAAIRRCDGAARRTPIIAMTAGAMPGDHERALQSGMDDVVTKPVVIDDLGATLDRWARGGGAVRADQRASPVAQARAAPGHPLPVLDCRLLSDLEEFDAGSRPGAIRAVVGVFVHTARQRLVEVEQALTGGDTASVARLAHSLKGSSANLAAARMAAAAEELEVAARTGDRARARELVHLLGVELRDATAALEAAFPARPDRT